MAKTIILGKTPYRVLKRRKMSISLQPIGTEYPHSLLLRRSVADPRRSEWRDQWGHVPRGSDRVTWYRQLSDDIFEKIA